MMKSVEDFTADVSRDFPGGFKQFLITDTNLGQAVDYSDFTADSGAVTIQLELAVIGAYSRGGQFSNLVTLEFDISFRIEEFLLKDFKIIAINKVASDLRFQKEERVPFFEKQVNFNGLYSWSGVNNTDAGADFLDRDLNITNGFGYSLSIELIRMIAAPVPEEFSWSIGFGFSEINFQIQQANYFYSEFTMDQDNDQYFHNVQGENIVEDVRLRFIDIPVRYRYERQFANGWAYYLHPGLQLSYNLETLYSGSGIFSYSGYYPQYDLVLENLEEYNFVSDEVASASRGQELSQYTFSGTFNGGLTKGWESGWTVYLGITAFKNIISNQVIDGNEFISTQAGEYMGMLPSVNSVNAGGVGLQVGFRKRFKTRNGPVRMIRLN
jgi:hypothetical protein